MTAAYHASHQTVLSNGEKTDNKQLESLLLEDERIAKVVTFGSGRFINGVIIESRYPVSSKDEFLSSISTTLKRVNDTIPRHSRLLPEMILLADPKKPFSESDKGTIKYKDTVDNYADEIEKAYSCFESSNLDGPVHHFCDVEEVLKTLKSSLISLGLPELSDDADFFDNGSSFVVMSRYN